MTEVRCPMCGKPNPPEALVCQYCQARLKPLSITPASQDFPHSEHKGDLTNASEAASSIPEWLQSLRATDEPPFDDRESSPDSEIEPDSQARLSPDGETPDQDWLSALRHDGEPEEARFEESERDKPISRGERFLDDDAIPAWLAELREVSANGLSHPASAYDDSDKEEEGEEVDWLKEIRSVEGISKDTSVEESELFERTDAATEFESEKPSSQNEEIQAELESEKGIPPEELPVGGEEPEKIPIPGEEAIPNWLVGLNDQKGPEKSDRTEYVPDWLQEIKEGETSQEESESSPSQSPVGEEKSHPEWFEKISGEEGSPTPKEEELPDFLQGTTPPFPSGIEGLLGELPEWLEQEPRQEIGEQDHTVDSEGAEAEQAELPVWLEALRPTETATTPQLTSDESDHRIESAGPLMGMKGALPAEPDIAQQKNPPVFSVKLNVTEKQKSVADQIEAIVKSEGDTLPSPARPTIGSQTILRVAIFVGLVAAILYPMILGTLVAPLPMYSNQTYDFSQEINRLSGGAPVLVSFDYEPGYSGEIEALSTIVLDHLMVKGAFLTLVSTIPSGPLQAERLITFVNTNGGHKYQAKNQYLNMGFIPGSQSGLLALAENPRQVIPWDIQGSRVWESNPLKNISTLSDFSLVIVLTDSPERVRAWIEQVQPRLKNTPLIMAISAQAEPIVQPYYSSNPRQVAGIVAGLAGGASYEKLVPRPAAASRYWNSYSISMSVASGLVVLGSVVSISMLWISHRKYGKLEEEG